MIGLPIRDQVFRDTPTFYNSAASTVSPRLIRFVQEHAGPTILDVGCATGDYCVRLNELGYRTQGTDINAEYVQRAHQKGVQAYLASDPLPFGDKSFDTLISFEVLEHLADPSPVLKEMKRLARKNVLLTVPNCESIGELQQSGLLLEHFADLDHKNFFTQDSLYKLLSSHFDQVRVERGDPLSPAALVAPAFLRFLGKAAARLGLIQPRFYFRLFAICTLS